ncbi:MAG: HU family DNA-binding protein [Bacteroidales bacterium]|nr:HU family DNA-binding protein [Bacteroidales bacterium]
MSKILVKSVEQNINYLQSGEVKSGYMLRPVRYSTIEANHLIDTIADNSYVPRAFVSATLYGIVDAIENFLMNGHSISLPNLGIFSLSCESNVAKTPADAGIEQFKKLNINFRPSVELKEKLDRVDLELDGVWKCLNLNAKDEEKIYQRINQNHDGVELPNGDGDEVIEPENPENNNPGGGTSGGGGFEG